MRTMFGCCSLAPETIDRAGARRILGLEHLQRHAALEQRVPGLVDDPHPAPAELPDDPILAQGEARCRLRSARRRDALPPGQHVEVLLDRQVAALEEERADRPGNAPLPEPLVMATTVLQALPRQVALRDRLLREGEVEVGRECGAAHPLMIPRTDRRRRHLAFHQLVGGRRRPYERNCISSPKSGEVFAITVY